METFEGKYVIIPEKLETYVDRDYNAISNIDVHYLSIKNVSDLNTYTNKPYVSIKKIATKPYLTVDYNIYELVGASYTTCEDGLNCIYHDKYGNCYLMLPNNTTLRIFSSNPAKWNDLGDVISNIYRNKLEDSDNSDWSYVVLKEEEANEYVENNTDVSIFDREKLKYELYLTVFGCVKDSARYIDIPAQFVYTWKNTKTDKNYKLYKIKTKFNDDTCDFIVADSNFNKTITLPNGRIRKLFSSYFCYYSEADREVAERYIENYTDCIPDKSEKESEEDTSNIKKVIFSAPATVIYWNDGTKTVSVARDEPYDPEKGLSICFTKKLLGNKYKSMDEFYKLLQDKAKDYLYLSISHPEETYQHPTVEITKEKKSTIETV